MHGKTGWFTRLCTYMCNHLHLYVHIHLHTYVAAKSTRKRVGSIYHSICRYIIIYIYIYIYIYICIQYRQPFGRHTCLSEAAQQYTQTRTVYIYGSFRKEKMISVCIPKYMSNYWYCSLSQCTYTSPVYTLHWLGRHDF